MAPLDGLKEPLHRSSWSTSCIPTPKVTLSTSTSEEGAEAWLLWAKSASACGASLTVTCVLNHAAAMTNWDAGGIQAPVASLTLSNENPQSSPCFALMKVGPNGIDLRQGDHTSHAIHLELQP